MVENKCSICKKQVPYRILLSTDRGEEQHGDFPRRNECEWCCLKCLWNKLPTIAGPEEKPMTSIQRMTGNPDGKVPFVKIGTLDTDQQRDQRKTDKKGLRNFIADAVERCSKPKDRVSNVNADKLL